LNLAGPSFHVDAPDQIVDHGAKESDTGHTLPILTTVSVSGVDATARRPIPTAPWANYKFR
jgi:hypothetical protein